MNEKRGWHQECERAVKIMVGGKAIRSEEKASKLTLNVK